MIIIIYVHKILQLKIIHLLLEWNVVETQHLFRNKAQSKNIPENQYERKKKRFLRN